MSAAATISLVVLLASAPGADLGPVEGPPPPHVAEDGTRTRSPHLQLDGVATWGIGSQMFLGTQLRFAALFEHWTTARALGSWDLGLNFAYQNEPMFLAPWIDPNEVSGAGHRTHLVASVGHSVHMGKRRRFALGLHAWGGWSHFRSDYSLEYANEGVSGSGVVTHNRAIVGGELRMAYRFHERVGLSAVISAPVPTESTYLISLAQVGLGLAFYLR